MNIESPATKQYSGNEYVFERMPVLRAVATLALPTIVGMLITMVYNLADTYFIGRTNNAAAIAAVSLAFPAQVALVMLSNLFGIGGSGVIARCLGRGEADKARYYSSFCFYSALLAALLYSAAAMLNLDPFAVFLGAEVGTLSYTSGYVFWTIGVGAIPSVLSVVLAHLLRGEGGARLASIGLSMGGVLNMLLDPLFMFVLLPKGMEVTGAAVATMLSNLATLAYFIWRYLRHRGKTNLSIRIRDYRCSREIVGSVLSVGLPSALHTLFSTCSHMALNRLLVRDALLFAPGQGPSIVAAAGIVRKIDMIPANVTVGMAQGVLPLLAYNHASGDRKRMHRVERCALILDVCFACVCVAAFEVFAEPLVRVFIKESATVTYGAAFLRRLCVAMPFMAAGYLITSLFQAMGQGRQALIISFCRKGVVEIGVMFALSALIPIYGILWAQPVVDSAAAVLAALMYAAFSRKLARQDRIKANP